MTILVTGATGQVGSDVVATLRTRGHEVLAPVKAEMDISDAESVEAYFHANAVDAVIHCAAWTAVDAAEDMIEKCRAVNVFGTSYLTNQCIMADIPIIYISTDYVFNGSGNTPWRVNDPTDPINQYGLSKRDGELEIQRHRKHFIVRTSWAYGVNGGNFVKTMLNLSQNSVNVRVVADQIGSPTYTPDLAKLLSDMVVTEKYGTYHVCNEGYCSWFEFAEEIFRLANVDTEVIPVTSEQFHARAKRPMNSRLDTTCLESAGFSKLPCWKDSLKRFFNNEL